MADIRSLITQEKGFTLIEISIVLVIIGLIVGGVLVGQNLIQAAAIRAQITQIEKFNQAVNTFFGKFHAWPGDMDPGTAASFGLPTHLPADGVIVISNDGLIEGNDNIEQDVYGQGSYETGQFWLDLSSSAGGGLIEGNFSGINAGCGTDITASNVSTCFPAAKIGNGNFISVFPWNNANWYGISAGPTIDPTDNIAPNANGLTVAQAYAIDNKMDDGFPYTGNVVATMAFGLPPLLSSSLRIKGSATTCYNNGNVSGAPKTYSVTQGNGTGVNCVLSFKIQGGD